MRAEFSRPHYSSSSSLHFFFIVALLTQIQTFAHLVEEIGTAVFLVALHIQIGIVAIPLFDFHPEYPTEKTANSLIAVLHRRYNAIPVSRKSIRSTRRAFPSNDARVRTASVLPAFCCTDAANPIPY